MTTHFNNESPSESPEKLFLATNTNNKKRGLLLVISAPSGCGKTVVTRRLLENDTNLVLSVSATTRPKRPGEIDGQDYHFLSADEFNAKINRNAFLEHAEVYDNQYGTPKDAVFTQLAKGYDVVFDIDWQGASQLKASAQQDIVTVFILPPSIEELAKRLRGRGLDKPEVVNKRLEKAESEIGHWLEYDYVIVNDELERSVRKIQTIIKAERMKRIRQPGLCDFVGTMVSAQKEQN